MLPRQISVRSLPKPSLRNLDGAIRIPDEALQELELYVGDAVYLIEEFVGHTRCLVLSKTPQITDRIGELTEGWESEQHGIAEDKLTLQEL